MAIERSDAELAGQAAEDERLEALLEATLDDLVSFCAVEQLDEHPDVCEAWVDRVWDNARARLTHDDAIAAVLMLLNDDACARARELLRSSAVA